VELEVESCKYEKVPDTGSDLGYPTQRAPNWNARTRRVDPFYIPHWSPKK
jgi:hypothetical protein